MAITNKVLPKAGLNDFYETFIQGSIAVILLSFCARNPLASARLWRATKQ